MKIYLYNMSDELNVINKKLSSQLELDCTLRDSCNVLDPSIFIRKTDADGGSAIPTYNYAYIPEFNRYYFISDITSVNNQLWRIDMHVDVLMSYKDSIYNTKAIVERMYNFENADFQVDDKLVTFGKYEFMEEVEVDTPQESGFTEFNTEEVKGVLLVTFSTNTSIGATGNPPKISDVLENVNLSNIPNYNQYSFYYLNDTQYKQVSDYLIKNSSDASGVVSTIIYPFDFKVGVLLHNIYINDKILDITAPEVSFENGNIIKNTRIELDKCINKMSAGMQSLFATKNLYGNIEPYTIYELYIPYKGWVDIPSNFLLQADYNNTSGYDFTDLTLYYIFNPVTQTAYAVLTDEENGKLLYYTHVSLGVNRPFTQSNIQENNDKMKVISAQQISSTLQGMGQVAGGAIGGAAKGGAGGAAMGIQGFFGGIAQVAGAAVEAQAQQDILHQRVTSEPADGETGQYLPQKARLRITTRTSNTTKIDQFKGYVSHKLMYIKDGFAKKLVSFLSISDAHYNIGNATKKEVDEIDVILKNGILKNPEE